MKKIVFLLVCILLSFNSLLAQDVVLTQNLGHDKGINMICISPDGKYLLSGDDDGVIKLWDKQLALVPELSKKHKGQPQFPTGYGFGMDFPIVIVK